MAANEKIIVIKTGFKMVLSISTQFGKEIQQATVQTP
jgi:hypothetical protein